MQSASGTCSSRSDVIPIKSYYKSNTVFTSPGCRRMLKHEPITNLA